MNADTILSKHISLIVNRLYQLQTAPKDIVLQKTKKEFEGDYTLVVFPFVKASKTGPEQTAQQIGAALKVELQELSAFNVVKGFLNMSLSDAFWLKEFSGIATMAAYGPKAPGSSGKTVMLEYSSPNTNKPLHLGHIRNNLLGYSVSELLKSQGHHVIKVNLVNDRGIHICKSMLAWMESKDKKTPNDPQSQKGDKIVGDYYVRFDKWSKNYSNALLHDVLNILYPLTINPGYLIDTEIFQFATSLPFWAAFAEFDINADYTKDDEDLKDNSERWFLELKNRLEKLLDKSTETDANIIVKKARDLINTRYEDIPLVKAKKMLQKWEAGDPATIELWKTMNSWVYDGFASTYKNLGVDFDKIYYESNTYLLGKEVVQEGLDKGVFFKKDDGSVRIDLSAEGLDEKVVLRSDGTSVYITQDLGTAIERFKEFPAISQMIYTVGNEQEYHFKVLFKILDKLGYAWAKECYHLSYGMVELPEGKMKSREGTVVDADDLIGEMVRTARETTEELGKVEGFSQQELTDLYQAIGMGALKYFLLKVDPKKKMLFDPKESIDFNGHTGPFIQYTHARIKSILRNYNADVNLAAIDQSIALQPKERELIRSIYEFPAVLEESAAGYNPGLTANYVYELTKLFNQFYHECPVLKAETDTLKQFRVRLSAVTASILHTGMGLLGVQVPERM